MGRYKSVGTHIVQVMNGQAQQPYTMSNPMMRALEDGPEPMIPLNRSDSGATKMHGVLEGMDLESEATQSLLCCPSTLSAVLSSTLGIFSWCGGFHTVNPNEEVIILGWGKYVSKITKPGWYCINMCGTEMQRVSTKTATLELNYIKVADGNGNPIQISGVVTYRIVNSPMAALNVQDVHSYVNNQALAVLKRVCSSYPYESHDNTQPSLKSEADSISSHMVELLQARVTACGVHILNYEMTDLSYAPEIAQAMLARQQAQALVAARKVIVEGAVNITQDAVNGMAIRGLEMTSHEKAVLATNLLTVICGQQDAQPTVPLGGNDLGHTAHRK